ncbi:MAG: helix-turn-helix transcriptional regulator [Eubacteriales bacterium]|nr:helix-turn-helix transcriptional regulator [Eubacteriales bacterium]
MKQLQGQVFKRYLFSYVSVALAVCLVLGITLTLVSTRELQQAEIELHQGRLVLAADYIERQLKAMEDIQLDIKTNLIYQPFYLKRDVIHDLELIDHFAQYSSYSSWIQEYYLWYREMDKVYGANSAYTGDVFFRQVMGAASVQERLESLLGAEAISFDVLESRPDMLMIAIPFYFGTARAPTEKCALVFLVKLNTLRQMVWEMTGTERETMFSLTCEDRLMLGSPSEADNGISAMGTKNRVRLTMQSPSFSAFKRLTSFETMTLAIVIAVAIAAVLLAGYAAWRNYQPIGRLYGKYAQSGEKHSNELQTIEELLSSTLKINTLSQGQLVQQMDQLHKQEAWLKQQLVMMLISGNDSPVVQRQIQELGFEMAHGSFAILFIHLNREGDNEGLLKNIEDFSDEECSLYAAELQEDREYAVLINYDEEEERQDLMELLAETLTTRELSARIQLSRSCNQLKEIASAAIEALNMKPVNVPVSVDEEQAVDGLKQLMSVINTGNLENALTLLDTMIAQTENRYPSYLMRIYMLNMLNQRIAALAYQAGVWVATEPENAGAQTPEVITQRMRRMVEALCMDNAQTVLTPNEQTSATAAYVRDNCLSASISLSSTALALGISTKQVTRLLRADVGATFKEYLLQLRMEAAKRFLHDEDLTIAQTAEKVGYFNISHFIKCFKLYTGVTPGEWKKIANHKA